MVKAPELWDIAGRDLRCIPMVSSEGFMSAILTDFSPCDSILSEYQAPETPHTRLDL